MASNPENVSISWRHHGDPNDNMSLLAQVMAWHRLGVKPLTILVLTKRFNAMRHHQATMS